MAMCDEVGRIFDHCRPYEQLSVIPPRHNSTVAFPIGTEIQVLWYGTIQPNIAFAGGVTLNSNQGFLKIGNQYTGVTLVKVGTNEWYVIGNLVA
jgi:hypothetical protein